MELFRALAALAECPEAEHGPIAQIVGLPGTPDAATYTALFSLQLYPYASVYLGAEGMLGGEARDRVAGFWRALGLVPPPEADHLATLLALYAELREHLEKETEPLPRSALDRARSALLWEHLLPWVPLYARKMRAIAGDGFYGSWAELLERTLLAEAGKQAASCLLPLHLREAPPCSDPREDGARPFLAALLAPVRSGFIVVRDDLARAARQLGLGLRQGERRFVLESLFAQERGSVVAWLEAEALAASQQHCAIDGLPAVIRDFWSARAAGTAALLRTLREAEPESVVAGE